MEVSWNIALGAGFISFFSPCVLPLLPFYIGYLGGSMGKDSRRWSLFRHALSFVLGFSLVFVLFGIFAAGLGMFLADYREVLRFVAGIIIIIFGLNLLEIFTFTPLLKERRFFLNKKESPSDMSSFFLGFAFAFGWTPCIGPVLGSILLYAATLNSISYGTFLLSFYALGLGLPFLFLALFFDYLKNYLQKYNHLLKWFSRAGGLLLLIFGILLLGGKI